MKTTIAILQILLAPATFPGQIDSVCRAYCRALAVQDGVVRFVDQVPQAPRNLNMGNYVAAAQRFVPATEAPVRDLRSPHGWRIVASAYLHHDPANEGELGVRLRFFGIGGADQLTDDVLAALDRVDIGYLFGGNDEIFAITSEEEHSYNVETEIWLLPEQGKPKRLLWIRGVFEKLANGDAGSAPGVTIARQTYDGVHAETKGTVEEFYRWDPQRKSLSLQKQ